MDVEPDQLCTRAAFPKRHVDAVDLIRSESARALVVEWLGVESDGDLLAALHVVYYGKS